jgi:hypothetical protein
MSVIDEAMPTLFVNVKFTSPAPPEVTVTLIWFPTSGVQAAGELMQVKW